MEEERARRLAAARAYAEELDTLGERPSSTWPASVRTLVKQRESGAAEVCSQCGEEPLSFTHPLCMQDVCSECIQPTVVDTGKLHYLHVQASALAAKKEAAATEAALESDLQEAKDAAQHAKAEQRKAEAARYDAFLAASLACHCTLQIILPQFPPTP